MNSQKVIEKNKPGMGRRSNSEEEESNEVKVPDYVDNAGRRWHFLCHAKEEEDLAQFVQQNGLVPGNENGRRRKFGCSRPECHFRAVFLKANSGIYTRGEHWHEEMDGSDKMSRDIPNERIVCSLSARSKIICRDNVEIFVGSVGKEFKLVRRFDIDEEFEKYRRENWLMKSGTIKSKYNDSINFSCRRRSNPNKVSTNCRFSGVYVKRNRSLYQNNQQHNHPTGKANEDYFSFYLSQYADEKKADYVDQRGQHWHFLRQIDNFEEMEKFTKEQMLYLLGKQNKSFYFKCKYATLSTLKKHPYPPPYCQMRAIFVKATSSVYVRNEHSNHPAFKLGSHKKGTRNDWIHRELAKLNNGKNGEKDVENDNAKENVPVPKEEANSEEGEEEEVRIVKHLQRDYKCLGRMKREEEGKQNRSRTDSECLTTAHTIQLNEEEDMDLEEGTSQGTRRSRGTFYRYTQRELGQGQSIIKKEEPEEEAEAALPMPEPQVRPNIAWLQQFQVARPAKMLLRERKKRINYGK